MTNERHIFSDIPSSTEFCIALPIHWHDAQKLYAQIWNLPDQQMLEYINAAAYLLMQGYEYKESIQRWIRDGVILDKAYKRENDFHLFRDEK